MKRIFFLSLVLFGLLFLQRSFGQDTLIPKQDTQKQSIEDKEYRLKTDTIKVETFIEEGKRKEWWDSNNMAWIVSLAIGIATVLISRWVTISNNKNAQKLALTEFQANLNSSNRQNWINEVRHCISELLGQIKLLNIHYNLSRYDVEKVNDLTEKISYNRAKLFLLLNPNINQHNSVIIAIRNLINELDTQKLNNTNQFQLVSAGNIIILQKSEELIEAGRALVYFEWQKIQNFINTK